MVASAARGTLPKKANIHGVDSTQLWLVKIHATVKKPVKKPGKSSLSSQNIGVKSWNVLFTTSSYLLISQKCLGRITFPTSTLNYYLITLTYSQLRPHFKNAGRSFRTWMGHNLSGPAEIKLTWISYSKINWVSQDLKPNLETYALIVVLVGSYLVATVKNKLLEPEISRLISVTKSHLESSTFRARNQP